MGGRGGSRGGGRGGRGGRRGGRGGMSDAASSEDPFESQLNANTKKAAGKKRTPRAQTTDEDEHANTAMSMKRAQRHEDMYGEVDDFMESRHRIALNGRDDDDDQDEDDDDQQHGGKSFELEGLEDDDDDEDDYDDMVGISVPAGAQDYDEVEAAETAQARQRELENEANISKAWGKRKGTYYNADTADFELESDEDIAAEEEAEGKRLQREQMEQIEDDVDEVDDMLAMVAEAEDEQKSTSDASKSKKKKTKGAESSDAELLKAMDADLDNIQMAFDLDMDMDFDTVETAPAKKSAKGKSSSSQGVLIEKIAKDVSSLSESAKLEQLLTSSPELLSLLDDFKAYMTELQDVLPAWEELKDQQQTDKNKALYCYLSLKLESLIMYCCHVSFYLNLKAEGNRNTQQHPIMKTMLQLRQTITTLNQMNDYFAQLVANEEEDDDDDDGEGEEMEGEDDDEMGELEEMEDEDDADDGEDDEDADDADGGLGDDFGSADDDGDDADFADVDPSNLAQSDLMARQASQLDRLLAEVGQKTKSKKSNAASSVKVGSSDFGEVDHKAEMARNVTIGKASGKLAALQARVKESASELKKSARQKRSFEDEEDENEKDDLDEFESNQPKKKAKLSSDAAAAAYADLKSKKLEAKAARKAVFAPVPMPADSWAAPMGDNDKRKVTKQIDVNRGLVRSRDKQRKTPKTRNRARWDKKKVARAGQVQEYKGSQSQGYGGQATGIKTNVTKSISLR